MSVTPRGMSIQELYRLYREELLLVNRRYQRKLVWTTPEKERLIDSILAGFPVPLLLLCERPQVYGSGKLEIVDGLQRTNAIVSFIENQFAHKGRYFPTKEFTRANQAAAAGFFIPAADSAPKLSERESAGFLDYQLAVTVYPENDDNIITEVFGRINAGGRQLSDHEKRQAGVSTLFGQTVRQLASEVRGDVSSDLLSLTNMPSISIESGKQNSGYGIRADETFWCEQGILLNKQLKESDDEEVLADLVASVVLRQPIAASREFFDALYNTESSQFRQVEASLTTYGSEKLKKEILAVFSVLKNTLEDANKTNERSFFRKTVNPGSGNPVRAAFYAVFMAYFELLIRENRIPTDPVAIVSSLQGLQKRITTAAHYSKPEDRTRNIGVSKGLIEKFFAAQPSPVLGHGPALELDIENALRRSRIESSRYECKQGLVRLANPRLFDDALMQRVIETLCGIANLGPRSEGFVFLGVADSDKDVARISQLDGIQPYEVSGRHIVGVDREAKALNVSLEHYVRKITDAIRSSGLTEPLKTHLLGNIEPVVIKGLTVIRIFVPSQKEVSFVGDEVFIRENSSTIKVVGPRVSALFKLFS